MMPSLTRRDFIRSVPALLVAPRLLTEAPIHIALVYSADYERAVTAARMSAAEASRTATLLGRRFQFTTVQQDAYTWDADWTGIISATTRPIAVPGVPVVDIAKVLPCGPHVFRLQPPAQQCPPGARCAIWHASLERFGAEQLNDRFRAAGIELIDDQTWLGWFAVKCLWEAAARSQPLTALGFDGHKGMQLRFNRAGVLMQPIYVLSADGSQVRDEIRPAPALEELTCAS